MYKLNGVHCLTFEIWDIYVFKNITMILNYYPKQSKNKTINSSMACIENLRLEYNHILECLIYIIMGIIMAG